MNVGKRGVLRHSGLLVISWGIRLFGNKEVSLAEGVKLFANALEDVQAGSALGHRGVVVLCGHALKLSD